MIETTGAVEVHEIQEAGGTKALWGLTLAPEALWFHSPMGGAPIPVRRQSLERTLRILPRDATSLMTVRLHAKVKFTLPTKLRLVLEDWIRADWRTVLAGELKDESLSAMIFGAIWMGFALLELLNLAIGTPDAKWYLILNAVFGGTLLLLALLGRLVVRPLTLLCYPAAWMCFGGWIGYGVATGRTHWAWLLLLLSLLLGMIFTLRKYGWYKGLAARFP